jgi:hypothetical protein
MISVRTPAAAPRAGPQNCPVYLARARISFPAMSHANEGRIPVSAMTRGGGP